MNHTDDQARLVSAQPQKAVELVCYQHAAVVSRELLRNHAGTVTVFAFDAGQGLSEHTAPFDALVHVLEGEVKTTISRITHRLCAGEMILMPANVPHALEAITRSKMLLTMLRA